MENNSIAKKYSESVVRSHAKYATSLLLSSGVYGYLSDLYYKDIERGDLGYLNNSSTRNFLSAELPVTVSMRPDKYNDECDLLIYRFEKFYPNGEPYSRDEYGPFVFLRNENGVEEFRYEDMRNRTEINNAMKFLISTTFEKILEDQRITGFNLFD